MSVDPSQLIDPSMAADASQSAEQPPADASQQDPGAADANAPTAAQDPSGAGLRPRLIPGSDAQSGNMPAGPQEQSDLSQTVDKALRMIHGRKSREHVLKSLHDPSSTIAEVVGRATFNILMSVSDQRKAVTREPLAENILQEAAGYVVPELMTVGCAAGIFPFEPPPDGAQGEPGQGTTDYDRQCRLAMLEAVRIYGQEILRSPDGSRRSDEAQNEWARGVASDVQAGKADPKFVSAMKNMRGQNQFPPSGTGDTQEASESAPPPAPTDQADQGAA